MRKLFCAVIAVLLLTILSGCHEEDFPYFHWVMPEPGDMVVLPTTTPEAPPIEIDEPEVLPEEEVGVAEPVPTPEPPCELIKGNISSSGEKIYHLPDGAYYDQVKINEETGEDFFCSEQEAIDAGFRKSSR